ncbi:MAG: pyruvate ferredoxin oxidoreductase [Prevotella sp.]|nr:pyruvate ferredoxin oxidoreductase [Prevotella sp.]
MDYKYIEQLVERYFEAETTLQEEQILRAFYAQADADMPDELRRWAPVFEALGEQPALGDDFDERLLSMTEGQPQRVKARTVSLTERLRPLFKAAAIVAVVLSLSNAINQSLQPNDTWTSPDSYATIGPSADEPAMAYEQGADSIYFSGDSLRLATGTIE